MPRGMGRQATDLSRSGQTGKARGGWSPREECRGGVWPGRRWWRVVPSCPGIRTGCKGLRARACRVPHLARARGATARRTPTAAFRWGTAGEAQVRRRHVVEPGRGGRRGPVFGEDAPHRGGGFVGEELRVGARHRVGPESLPDPRRAAVQARQAPKGTEVRPGERRQAAPGHCISEEVGPHVIHVHKHARQSGDREDLERLESPAHGRGRTLVSRRVSRRSGGVRVVG